MNLDEKAKQAISLAEKIASQQHANYLSLEHVIFALLSYLPDIELPFKLQQYLDLLSVYDEADFTGPYPYTPRLKHIFAVADRLAENHYNLPKTSCECLLLAGIQPNEGVAYRILKQLGFPFEEVGDKLRAKLVDNNRSLLMDVSETEDPANISIDQIPGKTIKKVVVKNIKTGTHGYDINGASGDVSEKKVLELHFTDGTTFEYER